MAERAIAVRSAGPPRWRCVRPFRLRGAALLRVRAAEEPPETKKETGNEPGFGLEELGPVKLGRKSRQAFDDLWTQFATLASPTKSFSDSALYEDSSFVVDPEARRTRVLVVGAAGRTGRVVMRKLLLRGYQIRVFVRDASVLGDMIPSRVEVVVGDVLDNKKCQEAVEGVDKVVFSVSPKTMDPEEYRAVFQVGLKQVMHAFMDDKWVLPRRNRQSRPKKKLADFKRPDTMDQWEATVLGRVSSFPGEEEEPLPRCGVVDQVRQWSNGQNSFIIKQSEAANLQFRGAVNDVGWAAEIGGPVTRRTISRAEGVVMRIRGDGNIYGVVCKTEDGQKFTARFVTKWGYSTVRIPFTLFRPDWGGSEALDTTQVVSMGFRFENRGRSGTSSEGYYLQSSSRFNLEVDWIKTLPARQATEFVLVSCAGVPREKVDLEALKQILIAQRTGESMLRNSGLGYTIVRPTTLLEEPGGLKALVFDQVQQCSVQEMKGERLTQSISTVDVADVTVRSLPQPLAANMTFEVAHEDSLTDEETEDYELVAHVPDKSTNYIGAAMANLQKNT